MTVNSARGSEDSNSSRRHSDPNLHWLTAVLVYLSYAILIAFGHVRDFIGSSLGTSRYFGRREKKGFAVLLKSWESFYTRRLYHRIQDCWNRPIASAPSAHIQVMERTSTDHNCTLDTTENTTECLNLGSYNYLGFADDWQITCKSDVLAALQRYPISMCASRQDFGSTQLHIDLEILVARFLGKQAAVVYNMGYGTNSSTIPILSNTPGTLIISDTLNHTSIVNGSRSSQALVRVFKHNTPEHLEEVLREAIINGQPRHHRPWKKIIVLVEGVYSMEGAICRLPEIVKICKRYKAYIYVDEAHSIGALGKTGRGVCEHTGVDPADIDILMGTFTKSFGGMGGYIAASKEIIDYIRECSAGYLYHNAMSPIVCQQILTAFRVILGEDGTDIGRKKLDTLIENSNFFRSEMERLGLHVYGDRNSPIVPCMIYYPAKIAAFSRECLKRNLAVVVVGFPATSVILSRIRFCISAGHSRKDLEFAIKVIDEVTDLLNMKYSTGWFRT
jgi:serine palmitoyltransferase